MSIIMLHAVLGHHDNDWHRVWRCVAQEQSRASLGKPQHDLWHGACQRVLACIVNECVLASGGQLVPWSGRGLEGKVLHGS